MVRAGLIGCGRWGAVVAADLVQRGILAKIFTRSLGDRYKSLSDKFPGKVTACFEEFLGAVDVVFVTVPPEAQAAIACRCLAAGKHVWCEKPGGWVGWRFRAAVLAAEANRRMLYVNLTLHHHPAIRWLAERLRDVGGISSYVSYISKMGTFEADLADNWLPHDFGALAALRFFGSGDSTDEHLSVPIWSNNGDRFYLVARFGEHRTAILAYDRTGPDKRRDLLIDTGSGRKFLFRDEILYETTLRQPQEVVVQPPTGDDRPLQRSIVEFLGLADKWAGVGTMPWPTKQMVYGHNCGIFDGSCEGRDGGD